MTTSDARPALSDILAARDRIASAIRITPMLRKETLGPIVGQSVYIKCEHLQRTGSFKLRGALNLIAQLDEADRGRGVVTASAGNHAQGVAVAASEYGVGATIFMPEDASLAKVEATRGYGAQVVLEGAHLTAALEAAHAFAAQGGAVFVHPFDDPRIIAGQGTIGLEIVEQLPEVATLVVPVGGGGLAAGAAIAVKALQPSCRIVAVQAAAFPSLRASLEAGERVDVVARPTIADGIAVKQLGVLNFEVLRELVDEVVEVDEEELSTAILWSMERAKQVLEGAGAASLAALLSGKVRSDGPVVLIVAGGNIDPAGLVPVIRHGLTSAGRFRHLGTVIPDRPGELSRLLALLARLRVNILGVEHHREGVHIRMGETRVDLTLQTRNAEHVAEVEEALVEAGYSLLGESW